MFLNILLVLLTLAFLMFGWMKFTSPQMVEGFNHFGLPQWFRVVTGIVEVLAALLLFAGIWVSSLAFIGALILAATMIGAIITHIRAKDPLSASSMPIVLLALNILVLILI